MSAGGELVEYLVKLGVQLDEKNMGKLEGFLKSSEISAVALKDALKAAATAVYTFVKAFADTEEELANLAKKQGKTVERVRAEQTALKALGKTAQEVNRDQELHKTYLELVSINEAMALPNVQHVMDAISGMTNAFAALKSTVQYGLEWIRYYTLDLLKGPMKQFQEYFTKAREWLQVNMRTLAQRTGVFLSDFLKGLSGIIDTAGQLLTYINQLPAGFKAGIAAVGGFALALKSGPVGQLLMVVGLIGDLMLDYENYKKNLTEGTDIPVALPGIWEILDDSSLTDAQKGEKIMGRITGWITEAAQNVSISVADWLKTNTPEMTKVIQDIATMVQRGVESGTDIAVALRNAAQTILNNEETMKQLGETFGRLFGAIFGGANDISGALVDGILQALSGKTDEEWESEFDSRENSVLGIIGTAAIGKMFGLSNPAAIALGIASAIGKAFNGEDGADVAGEIEKALKDPKTKSALGDAVDKIWLALAGVNGFGSTIANALVAAVTGVTDAEWDNALKDNTVAGGLTTAVGLKLLGLDNGLALAGGIISTLAGAFSDPNANGFKTLMDDAKDLGGLIWGAVEDGFDSLLTWWNSPETQNELQQIENDINNAIFGEKDPQTQKRSGGLLDQLNEFLFGSGEGDAHVKGIFERIGDAWNEFWASELGQSISTSLNTAIVEGVGGALDTVSSITTAYLAVLGVQIRKWFAGVVEGSPALKGLLDAIGFKPSDIYSDDEFALDENGNVTTIGAIMGREDLTTRQKGELLTSSNYMPVLNRYRSVLEIGEDGKIKVKGAKTGGRGGSREGIIRNLIAGALDGSIDISPEELGEILSLYKDVGTPTPLVGGYGAIGTTLVYDSVKKGKEETLSQKLEEYSSKDSANGSGTAPETTEQLQTVQETAQTLEETSPVEATIETNAEEAQQGVEAVGAALDEMDGKTVESTIIVREALTYAAEKSGTATTSHYFPRTDSPNSWGNYDYNGTNGPGGGGGVSYSTKQALGGRFDRPTYGEFGEDGTEYIIPITKPARAADLILQMFGEMGSAATQRILTELGVGTGGGATLGGSLPEAGALLSGSSTVINYNNTVSAPVNITVQPGSASAETVGQTIYSYAERSLLQTLQGVLA